MATPDDAALQSLRSQLLEAIAYVSQDRYDCSWMPGLSRSFHEEGGIWEILGRVVGWPVGEEGRWVWMTWEQAAAHYQGASSAAERTP